MRRLFLLAVLAIVAPVSASAQSFHLRDLLTDFLREGITLAPPPAGFPSHEAHFIAADSPQFLAMQQFNGLIANQLSSFPLASSAGGFAYTYDPALGVFTRSTESFGPVYAERADTLGKGRFNLGLNFSHFTFDDINGLSLSGGDVRLVFTHQDINHDHTSLEPFFEGDVITAALSMKITSDITAFVFSYGLTDRFDVSTAIPIVKVAIDARADASIDRLGSGPVAPGIHRFLNGGSTETFTRSGSASGVGDVVLRAKYRLTPGTNQGVAVAVDARLPTGDQDNLLGTGATQFLAYAIGSFHFGSFSPHLNAGYQWALHPADGIHQPSQIVYTGGFDVSVGPKLTFVADILGRTYVNTHVASVQNRTFTANTNPDPTAPPTLVSATLPQLQSQSGDLNTLLGSVGIKINPIGNLLLTVNGLFSISKEGLQDKFTPLVGLDYSF